MNAAHKVWRRRVESAVQNRVESAVQKPRSTKRNERGAQGAARRKEVLKARYKTAIDEAN